MLLLISKKSNKYSNVFVLLKSLLKVINSDGFFNKKNKCYFYNAK